MSRRFEWIRAYQGRGLALPRRKTAQAAGYDIAAAETVTVAPGQVALVPTGLKAYMPPDEFLALYIRSSLAIQKRLALANGVAVIDADYADNPDNEGHILVAIANQAPEPVSIAAGERIAQGIFHPYAVTADDQPGEKRSGGLGSTGSF